MPISTRLTSAGTLYVNGTIDEVSQASISVSTNTVYAAELDETTINPVSGGVAKRENSTGILQVANEFDEFTGAPIVDSSLKVWVDAAQSSSYSGSGTAWNNLSPATGSFTLYNTPTFSGLNSGGAFSFLPSSFEYADNGTNLGNMPQYTVEAWAKTTASLTSYVTAIVTNQFNLASSLNFSLGTNFAPTNYTITAGFFDGSWHNPTGFTPSVNVWYHYVGTYDGTTLRFYVNGSQNSSLNYSGTPGSGGTIRIARRWDSADNDSVNFFPGEIGVVRVYNRALTADEISTNFAAHRNRYGI